MFLRTTGWLSCWVFSGLALPPRAKYVWRVCTCLRWGWGWWSEPPSVSTLIRDAFMKPCNEMWSGTREQKQHTSRTVHLHWSFPSKFNKFNLYVNGWTNSKCYSRHTLGRWILDLFVKSCQALVIPACEQNSLSVHYCGVSGYNVALLLVAGLM